MTETVLFESLFRFFMNFFGAPRKHSQFLGKINDFLKDGGGLMIFKENIPLDFTLGFCQMEVVFFGQKLN